MSPPGGKHFDAASLSIAAWRTVAGAVDKAHVYLDFESGELMRMCGADTLLWKGGALSVRQLPPAAAETRDGHASDGAATATDIASQSNADIKKVCVVVSTPLDDAKAPLKRLVSSCSSCTACTVFCAVSEATHVLLGLVSIGASDGTYKFHEHLIANWMPALRGREDQGHVYVVHAPLLVAQVTSSLFTLPHWSRMYPPPPNAHAIAHTTHSAHAAALADGGLPRHTARDARTLAGGLASLFDAMETREECFCVGHVALFVGSELARLRTASPPPQHSRRASIVIVDRTLDLASAASHADNLADRIYGTLPRRQSHSIDVAVDYTPLYCDPPDVLASAAAVAGVAHGALLHGHDARACGILTQIAESPKSRDAAAAARHAAVDLASKEGVDLGADLQRLLMGKATAEHIASVVRALALADDGRILVSHVAAVDVLLAAAIALAATTKDKRIERLLAAEKVIQLSCAEAKASASGATHPYRQLADLVRSTPDMLPFDTLVLLVHVLSLVGPHGHDDAQAGYLRMHLAESIVAWTAAASGRGVPVDARNISWFGERALSIAGVGSIDSGVSCVLGALAGADEGRLRDAVEDRLQALIGALVDIGGDRARLQRELVATTASVSGSPFQPLLAQLADAILDERRPELPDLENKSVGLKGLLKSGFGRFLSSVKPRPDNHPLLVIVVIGGVTFDEVRQVVEAAQVHRRDMQVVVGSTTLSTPETMLTALCAQLAPS